MRGKRFRPLILSAFIVLADQVSKAWVVATIPENSVGFSLFGDFLEIWHVRNTAVAFSMGTNLSVPVKIVAFIILPLLLLSAVARVLFSKSGKYVLTRVQRLALALFLGGGAGNLCDRIFRRFRVVDFMANRVYGLFGLEFWPTWNLADASLVVSAVTLVVTLLFPRKGGTLRDKGEKDV